ncbi:MAG: hypothetical protein GY861_18995 [bacterium]|nr:hypothetical protein [bacterium]
MNYKLAADGKSIEMNEKNQPIVVNTKGEEFGIDAIHLYNRLPEVNNESIARKEKIKELTTQLETFSAIEDPAAALEALTTVANLKDTDLKNKEDIDKLKLSLEEAWKGKVEAQKTLMDNALKAKDVEIGTHKDDLFDALVASQFSKSPFFAGEERTTNLPPDVAVKYFGEYYKVEKNDNGKNQVVGYIGKEPIYSQDRPGEYAKFDEAMPKIIEASGQNIMKESSGSGSQGGKGNFGGRVISSTDSSAISKNAADIASGKVKVQM